MFKPTPVRPPQPQQQELGCPRCGVILVVELPKGEAAYPCVCGYSIDVRMTQAA